MAKSPPRYGPASWTGDCDPIEAKVLAIVLALGVAGFVIIGAVTLG